MYTEEIVFHGNIHKQVMECEATRLKLWATRAVPRQGTIRSQIYSVS